MGSERASLGPLLRVGFPVSFVYATLAVMQTTDAFMVGHLGSDELAALTPPALLVFTIHNFGSGFLTSVTTYVAQARGRGLLTYCGRLAWQGIFLATVFGAGGLLLMPLAPSIISLVPNDSERVAALEVSYLAISLLTLAPSLVTVAISNFFVGIQRNRIVIVTSTLAVILNLVLNYSLIFGAMGLPALGMAGAAWGTVGATTFEALMLTGLFLTKRTSERYRTRRCRLDVPMAMGLVRTGLPAGIQSTVDVASWGVLLSWFVAFYGTAHQAATTVLIRCMQLSYLPAEGLAVALQTLVGSAVGAGDHSLARRHARTGLLLMGAYMTLLGAAFYGFRTDIMGYFSDDPAVVIIGAQAMVFVALLQPFDAMNVAYSHALNGVGDTRWPSQVNVMATVLILVVGGAASLVVIPQYGSVGIWGLFALYVIVAGLAFRFRWMSQRWQHIQLLSDDVRDPASTIEELFDEAELDAPRTSHERGTSIEHHAAR